MIVTSFITQGSLNILDICDLIESNFRVHHGGYNTIHSTSVITLDCHEGYKQPRLDVRLCITIQCQLAIECKYKSRLSSIFPNVIREWPPGPSRVKSHNCSISGQLWRRAEDALS